MARARAAAPTSAEPVVDAPRVVAPRVVDELSDLLALTKPGVTLLVVFTAVVGLVLAPAPPHPVLAIAAVLAIALGSGGAAALNMWIERESDARMIRTCNRPVPAGRIADDTALVFGATLSIVAFILLNFASGHKAALLLAAASVFYVAVYTPFLKPRTDQNIVIGGAAGALPPVIGWVVGGGELLHPLPWSLFLLIFLWTPPHFWALALPRRAEYAAASLPMLPVTRGEASTRRHIFVYALLLAAAAPLPGFFLEGVSSLGRGFYLVAATALGLAFAALALQLLRSVDGSERQARLSFRLFAISIGWLFALFAVAAATPLFP